MLGKGRAFFWGFGMWIGVRGWGTFGTALLLVLSGTSVHLVRVGLPSTVGPCTKRFTENDGCVNKQDVVSMCTSDDKSIGGRISHTVLGYSNIYTKSTNLSIHVFPHSYPLVYSPIQKQPSSSEKSTFYANTLRR